MAITEKQKAARTLGRLGGQKGGNARARALNPERRTEIARKAGAARWAKAGVTVKRSSDPLDSGSRLSRPAAFNNVFFAARTIDQLIAEQKVRPISDLSALAGTIPDEDIEEFVAGIYRDR